MSKTRKQKSVLPPVSAGFRRWREQFNPLRGLTIKKAITLLEQAQRGEYSDYQWTCRLMERRFPELSALIVRRTSALAEMDWSIKTIPSDDPHEQELAERQADRLREVYDNIENLYDAIDVLEMAIFRGYGFCEKIYNVAGELTELRPVDPWNLVRDGLANRWKYNPDALAHDYDSLGGEPLPLERFVYREVERPLNELALILFLRANNANKNWDAFLSIYGVPGGVVIGPPDMTPDQVKDFETAGVGISEAGTGVLPNGSQYITNDGPRGVNPFSDYLDNIAEALVLAGTGGKLTMLNEATGIGGSQGEVHADVFKSIASSDARQISEIFQEQIDLPLIEEEFPNQKPLAYFELNFREEVDNEKLVEMISRLSLSGLAADPQEISEKLGITLTVKEAAPTFSPYLQNRKATKQRSEPIPQAIVELLNASDLDDLVLQYETILKEGLKAWSLNYLTMAG